MYNLTDRVRVVIGMGREEAIRMRNGYVGTEHLLLGLIREGGGLGAKVLRNLNVDIEEIRLKIEDVHAQRSSQTGTDPELSFTSRAKKVMELAIIEARELNQSWVGTEHLLLGLLLEEKGIAAQLLNDAGLTPAALREEASRLSKDDVPERNGEGREEQVVALVAMNGRLRVVELRQDGAYQFLDETRRAHTVHLVDARTLGLIEAVEELEHLVNDRQTKEAALQDFFERHPDLLLSDQHARAHSHVALEHDDGKRLIPDFVLEPLDQGELCDVLDLKLPSAKTYVLAAHGHRLSALVLDAVRQLRAYSDYFEREEQRKVVYRRYGLKAFRPNLFVVIGRRGEASAEQRRIADGEVPGIKILTYDDLIQRVRARIGRHS